MRERSTDRVMVSLALVLLGLVLIEATLTPHGHPEFPWHRLPGYAALIGLAGCVVVVQISKWLGRWLLQRPETDE